MKMMLLYSLILLRCTDVDEDNICVAFCFHVVLMLMKIIFVYSLMLSRCTDVNEDDAFVHRRRFSRYTDVENAISLHTCMLMLYWHR